VRVVLQLIEGPPAGASAPPVISFELDGRPVAVVDDGGSLLEALREQLGVRSAKDGCSPQGQCGCCTVWVDGSPRVACVTPARRVGGRRVTTLEGLDPAVRRRWVDALVEAGASQCGFCTPGIVMRLAWLERRHAPVGEEELGRALAAHLCRCTGWRTIYDAATLATGASTPAPPGARPARSLEDAARRAALEGGSPQAVGPQVAEGGAGFADDTAPPDALVFVPDASGGWASGDSPAAARRVAGRIPGRNSTARLRHPLELPEGEFVLTLRTTFVEPAYLEPDASWCRPGGEPATPLANGGAFGGKCRSAVADAARRLADEHGRPVRVLYGREDVVRLGPKRPPVAAGVRADGTAVMHVARTPGSADLAPWHRAARCAFAELVTEERQVPGPPVSADLRAAGWAEAAVLRAAWEALAAGGWAPRGAGGAAPPVTVSAPEGATATVAIAADGSVSVHLDAGEVLDAVVLRSYVVGAVHQALGWVRREGLAVDDDGRVLDLTIRSFGVLPARDMPHVEVVLEDGGGPARRGSDAVFAATAAAAWLAGGLVPHWPIERGG
jgi:xanthine dehydrogenase small subunit